MDKSDPASIQGEGLLGRERPRLGFPELSDRPERVLLLCFYEPHGVSTVPETVARMQRHSRFGITVINLFEHRGETGVLHLSSAINWDAFQAVVIHNSLSYNVDNLWSLDGLQTKKLCQFEGVKVLMKQDENFRFKEVASYIGATQYDLILTCLPDEAIGQVYPSATVGENVRFMRMLTGYVTPALRGGFVRTSDRPIDIGYRGSRQPETFGRLAYEKRRIGEEVQRRLEGTGLNLDISSRWEDRFGGEAWFDFLRRCKAILGCESGASIFDLDGHLDERIAHARRELGGVRDNWSYYDGLFDRLADLEGNVDYGQIAPRHFEAAAMGSVQLLLPGGYSGRLQADRHYVELRRDYSNLDEAVRLIRDPEERERMAECAYREVILNPANWIETFVAELDHELEILMERKGLLQVPLPRYREPKYNIALLEEAPSSAALAPIQATDAIPLNVRIVSIVNEGVVMGTVDSRMEKSPASYDDVLSRYLRNLAADRSIAAAAVSELDAISQLLNRSPRDFQEMLRAPAPTEGTGRLRERLMEILNVNAQLLPVLLSSRGWHAVISTDLATLPAGLVFQGLFGVPVLYMPVAPLADESGMEPWEVSYLRKLESKWSRLADPAFDQLNDGVKNRERRPSAGPAEFIRKSTKDASPLPIDFYPPTLNPPIVGRLSRSALVRTALVSATVRIGRILLRGTPQSIRARLRESARALRNFILSRH